MLKSEKVLHLITTQSWGGLETYVYNLVRKLHEAGISTGVYCIKGSAIEKRLSEAGIPTYQAHKRSKFSIKDIRAVRQILRREGYNILHSHTSVDVWLGSLALLFDHSRKHIFSLYIGVTSKKDLVHWGLYQKVDAIVSTSEKINMQIRSSYPVKPDKVKMIRYGREVQDYNLNEEKRQEIRRVWGASEQDIVIGTMCRLDVQKGVRELAEAYLQINPDLRKHTKLWIIGERTIMYHDTQGKAVYLPESEELYKWLNEYIIVNSLEDQLKLIPYQTDLVGYLSALDIFVLASYNEMYALAVLDAMLMELPVVGTNEGGTTEQIGKNERGVLVQPKSSAEIARAIEELIAEPAKAQNFGKEGRDWVLQEHNWKHVLGQYLDLYQSL